jgi:hypothetical protein
MIKMLLGWLTGSTLDRVLSTVDKKFDNETERDRIRGEILTEYARSQSALLMGRGWWFPLLFLIPFGLWFASVCIYSMLFCADCIYPQTWTIAALPASFDQWTGPMIGSLFIGKALDSIASRWRR